MRYACYYNGENFRRMELSFTPAELKKFFGATQQALDVADYGGEEIEVYRGTTLGPNRLTYQLKRMKGRTNTKAGYIKYAKNISSTRAPVCGVVDVEPKFDKNDNSVTVTKLSEPLNRVTATPSDSDKSGQRVSSKEKPSLKKLKTLLDKAEAMAKRLGVEIVVIDGNFYFR